MIDPRQPPALYAEPMPPSERGRPRLIFPGLMRLYGPLSALAETVMRVVAGGVLVTVYFHWIVQAQGFKGSEYSIVWASIMLFFAVRGSNRHAVDALIGRQL